MNEDDIIIREDERCICCGGYVPEGTWVCKECQEANKGQTDAFLTMINKNGEKRPNNERKRWKS